jgi:hypothetical protein
MDNLFIIKKLPLYLIDSTRTWLEHLPRDKINDWTDLRRVFVGNLQGMYMRPGKQWELPNYKQQPGESLRQYIQRFSKCCTELPSATNNDAISVFENGTTCTSLIHRLEHRLPRTTRELIDIASYHADGEEAVAAMLNTPRARGNKSWTTARERPHASRRRRRTTSAVATTTWSQWWSARHRAPKATRPSPHRPRTTSRDSWTRHARTTRSPSSIRVTTRPEYRTIA